METESKPSYEELEAEVARLRAQDTARPAKAGRHLWRSFGIGLLIVLGCVGLVAADLSLWANRTVMSTDGFMKVVGPLPQQPPVQAALVKAANDGLTSNVDIPAAVKDALPEKAAFLAGPIADQIASAIQRVLTKVVSSPRFEDVWSNVASRAHTRVINVVANYQGDGQVDLQDAYKYLGAQLADTPLAAVANTSLPDKYGSIELISARWVPAAHQAYETVRWAVPVGFALVLACLGGAIMWSRRRRRTLMQISVAAALSVMLTAVVLRVAREVRLGQIQDPTYHAAAASVWHAFLVPMFTQTGVWLVIIGLVLVGAWITGPYRAAVGTRARLGRGSGNVYRALGSFGAGSPAVGWLRRRRRTVEWLLVGLTIVVLMFLTPLTFAIVGWSVVILVAAVVVVEILSSGNGAGVAVRGNK